MSGAFERITGVQTSSDLWRRHRDRSHPLPAGSGLFLACMLGVSGWYGIVRLIAWLARALS